MKTAKSVLVLVMALVFFLHPTRPEWVRPMFSPAPVAAVSLGRAT